MPQQPPATWPESLTAEIGRRIAHFRKGKFTAQQLSDALRDRLGVDMKRTVIGGLESGARKTISVSEVLALAYVLGVPPLLLVAPVGGTKDVEVLPGVTVDPWSVVRWAAGEGLHDQLDGGTPEYRALVDFLRLYRRHDQLIDEWDDLTNMVIGPSKAPTKEERDEALRRMRPVFDDIKQTRRMVRQLGEQPPPLPGPLEYLDRQEGSTGGDQEDRVE